MASPEQPEEVPITVTVSVEPPLSRLPSIVLPALEKIIKSASWRNSKLVSQCNSLIESFPSPTTAPSSVPGLFADNYSLSDTEKILSPLLSALASANSKLADPAIDCLQKLISHGILCGDAYVDGESDPNSKLLAQVIDSICSCATEYSDDVIELLVLKTLLSAITSTSMRIHGDCLLRIVRTCYDVYLGSKNDVNQTTAKASLIQMLVIVFRRMEADSSTVPLQPIVVAELMEPTVLDKGGGGVDLNMIQFVQGFITKVISDIDVVLNPGTPVGKSRHDGAFQSTAVETTNPADLLDSTDKDMLDAKYWEISMYKTALEGRKGELGEDGGGEGGDIDKDLEVQIGSKLRRDAFLVFRALSKLSMKSPPKEALGDPAQMRGKIVALELLKILLENAGSVFRTSDRFLGAIKQYLCLSLLKNSASPFLIVFQLSCSIFISLVSRFRSGLKAEIGVFFPMIVLRVLENVAQPNFQQKMIVLRLVEKLCVDSHILVDVFINYDCDVNSANIFERMVTGLLKTAQGVSPGVVTTLLPDEQATMKLEAMKCLVEIMKSMGDWMNKQLRIPDPSFLQKAEALEDNRSGREIHIINDNTDDAAEGFESQSDSANGFSDAVSIEQRRAYKLELQEGISLFNRKPKKGIDFLVTTKKVGGSPEEIASFLRNASGLNKTLIGDYLGEREELSLKVMHAYVDSFDFQDMEFDESIRVFLQGFRLPGEAQKIDRIMEKFAERYCKCNAHVFSSADTAYVLAYSVILLNTDAHNPMVKNKMSVDDFIRNNRGIDDGKDLPEEYMRSLYERILRNEIKMKEDDLTPQHSRSMNSNAILGLDSILNIVIQKRGEEKSMVTSDGLIRRMQEQFKEKARKSESPYYPATDVVTLRFMIEVCWAPMLAAFSVPLEQSYDEVVISLCLDGFRHAIHVTAVMAMKTHRDAFVTSLAKFTSLHSAADIKQRNIDAIKAIVAIADEDGNYLQDAWEHILTCVSRFEHLYLLGEGVLPDAAFFALPEADIDNSKQEKPAFLPVLKDKGVGHIHHPATAIRRGSYDSAGVGGHASGLVTSEQVFNLVSKFNMLEQVGPSEMNRIFTRSQKLNSEGIIDFVKALCKVSMEELRSSSEPRVFSLTKIVEIAHYNMDRIRLVWSSIWYVLSDFFVTIGCSENLSIAIFAMDSLRQLAMKFLEREELANYNFQNEFMKPFVIVMRKSRAIEIRELIIRCVSQMVLTRVDHVKSGWKSMFMVFSTASYDEHRNVVMLAFEIIERIVKDYFPYITETETTTFTDFVNCLIAFANSRFNKDVSLNAIAFLRICAVKLAEGEVGNVKNKDKETIGNFSQISDLENNGKLDIQQFSYKDDHLYLWFPLLVGLSELTFDLRLEIRKSALDILFETLRNHGHLFSLSLWKRVFDSVLFPIFDYVRHAIDPAGESHAQGPDVYVNEDQDAWLYDTCTLALQLVVDLFAIFYDTVNPLLKKVLMLLGSFIKRPHQGLAGIGIAAFVRLMNNAGSLFSDDNWLEVIHSLEEAVLATVPNFSHVVESSPEPSGSDTVEEDMQKEMSRMLYSAIADAKCHAAVQLLLIQAMMEIYSMYRLQLTTENTISLFQILHGVASHAQKINSDENLRSKLQELGSMTQMQDPPLLRLETESYQICIALLQNLIMDQTASDGDAEIMGKFVDLCKEILLLYLQTAQTGLPVDPVPRTQSDFPMLVPLGSAKRKELTARAPVLVATLQAISGLEVSIFRRNLTLFFPLLSDLISCEHGSNEVQIALSDMLSTCVGPVLLRSC